MLVLVGLVFSTDDCQVRNRILVLSREVKIKCAVNRQDCECAEISEISDCYKIVQGLIVTDTIRLLI